MKQKFRNGNLIEADNGQDKFLKNLYGSTFGRILLKPLVTPVVSNIAGAFLSTKCSCVLIKPFIRSNNIDMSQFENIKSQLQAQNIGQGNEAIQNKYPFDIKYNVCLIGKKALHNFEYTDSKIKEELQQQGYELINTTQGYTNCSIAVIDENSAIVTDKGLYKILEKYKIDVLYLQYEPDIKLLNNGEYSEKKGFIGGVISRIDNKIFISGDLNKIDLNEQIRKFIKKRNLEIIDFKGLDVIDYGGIVRI